MLGQATADKARQCAYNHQRHKQVETAAKLSYKEAPGERRMHNTGYDTTHADAYKRHRAAHICPQPQEKRVNEISQERATKKRGAEDTTVTATFQSQGGHYGLEQE